MHVVADPGGPGGPDPLPLLKLVKKKKKKEMGTAPHCKFCESLGPRSEKFLDPLLAWTYMHKTMGAAGARPPMGSNSFVFA